MMKKEYHYKCNTKGCTNYYNVLYKNSNGYCSPCNRVKKKKEKNEKR